MNSKSSRSPKGAASRSPLALWVEFHERQLGLSIKGRFRGNSLHLLCELTEGSDHYPSQALVHQHFEQSVGYAELNTLIPPGYPRIRHIWLYGRVKGAKKPAWTTPIHLNPVQRRGYDTKPFAALPEASPCEFSPASASEPTSSQPSSARSPSAGRMSGDASGHTPGYTPNDLPSNLPDRIPDKASEHSPNPLPDSLSGNLYALAEQGHPKAIAYSLHESLINLGINASIRVKRERNRPKRRKDRLWIACRADYSPAAALVGDPIARQLRALSLHNIEDAVLQFQVQGEDTPDWVLRIDLTPQEEILKDWARWGDVEAMSRLINQALQPLNSQLVEASLQGFTLHLHCAAVATDELTEKVDELTEKASEISRDRPVTTLLEVQRIRAKIDNTLQALAPQGLHNAVVYGPVFQNNTPEWVEWLTLSGKSQFDRGVSPLELATNGDVEAIAFLIRRVLNPDLSEQLATGGIFVQVLNRHHLLHIMCDAPLCPNQAQVLEPIDRLLRPLNIPGIQGLRLYGRRAGQRSPRWQAKIDFVKQPQVVPEPAPQFAATDAYVTELVDPNSEPPIREDLTPSELWTRWQTWRRRFVQGVRRSLLTSQFFVPTSDSPELMLRPTPGPAKLKTALVWGAVGALALVQVDLGLNQLSRVFNPQTSLAPFAPTPASLGQASPPTTTPSDSDAFAQLGSATNGPIHNDPATNRYELDRVADVTVEFHQSLGENNGVDDVFDSSSFISNSNGQSPSNDITSLSPTSPSPARLTTTATFSGFLENSPYPSFNSEQLDFKLALYYQRLLEVGPPDILILGSSRALRGIDPAILEQSLEELGYADADVFNFGVNGATAQVVELILQRILLPEQLPKLIVWADGARAFNSGRDDRTYNGILASEGYERLLDGSFIFPVAEQPDLNTGQQRSDGPSLGLTGLARSLSGSYQALDEQLSDAFAQLSASYSERDRIKSILQYGLTVALPRPSSTPVAPPGLTETLTTAQAESTSSGNVSSESSSNINSENPPLEAPSLEPSRVSLDAPTSLRATDNIDEDGFLPLHIRFDPTQYYQTYARVPGNYDKDYSNFRLAGTQDNALTTLLALGQTYNIPIVFINMPLTQEYLDPFRIAHEQTFRQYMLNLALQQEHFVFRDLGELWLDQAEHRSYFSDPSHLNQYGAYEVSQHISKDVMIPWNVTTR